MGDDEFAVDICNVSKRFGAIQSLDKLNLRVKKGEVLGLLGPNGAGKTTTLRSMLGLVRPDDGHVLVFGLNPQTDGPRVRRNTGVLLEGEGLYRRLTAMQNLDFHGRIWHLSREDRLSRAEELLRRFDLWERRDQQVGMWSKGMRQKLALARALLHRPALVLLDEPFSGLDPVAAVELRERIALLAQSQNVTVILAAHDLTHVEKTCNSVAVIRQGKVIAIGTPEELGGRASTIDLEVEVRAANLTEEILKDMQQDRAIVSYDLRSDTAIVICAPASREGLAMELMRRGVKVEELQTCRNSLEETFLSLVSESGDR